MEGFPPPAPSAEHPSAPGQPDVGQHFSSLGFELYGGVRETRYFLTHAIVTLMVTTLFFCVGYTDVLSDTDRMNQVGQAIAWILIMVFFGDGLDLD